MVQLSENSISVTGCLSLSSTKHGAPEQHQACQQVACTWPSWTYKDVDLGGTTGDVSPKQLLVELSTGDGLVAMHETLTTERSPVVRVSQFTPCPL